MERRDRRDRRDQYRFWLCELCVLSVQRTPSSTAKVSCAARGQLYFASTCGAAAEMRDLVASSNNTASSARVVAGLEILAAERIAQQSAVARRADQLFKGGNQRLRHFR